MHAIPSGPRYEETEAFLLYRKLQVTYVFRQNLHLAHYNGKKNVSTEIKDAIGHIKKIDGWKRLFRLLTGDLLSILFPM